MEHRPPRFGGPSTSPRMDRVEGPTTQVLQCGGVLVYQLLCGRELAADDPMARQLANYVYLVVNTHDRTAIAVDAAWDVEGLYGLASALGVTIRGAIYTHGHFDHCGGELPPFMTRGRRVSKPGARDIEVRGGRVWAGPGDGSQMTGQCQLSRQPLEVGDGDVLDCGDLVLHATGRARGGGAGKPGAASESADPRLKMFGDAMGETLTRCEAGLLITGDTVFVGSCGRTDLPGSDQEQMFASLSRLSKLDPSVLVLPGHNYSELPFNSVGAERAQNQMMRMGMSQKPSPPRLPPCVLCDNRGACGPKGLKIGRKVRIKGLTSDAGRKLNGQPGVVTGFASDKGRYAVRLISRPEVKCLQPDNVESVPSGETCDAPEPEQKEAQAPPTPREFVDAAIALIDNATSDEKVRMSRLEGPLDWGSRDPRWILLTTRLLNGGNARAAFGVALPEVISLLTQEFDPKWRTMVSEFLVSEL
ncbi:unnamed protein product [Prorocentrum cordatum]|uniref:Metallo-beta-lactamase domain-containing protein n=1 Tax=Prorocentrum cordatum TaxID=2364126 RepID=A0ABN9YH78_9DINO|nr:unnamed protein product [Polarella glacialis]